MSESESERALRIQQAQEDFLAKRNLPTGLIAPTIVNDGGVQSETVVESQTPLEAACYDALIYLREGMTRQDVLASILLRNRISSQDAEKIIDQIIEQQRNADAEEHDQMQSDD